MSKKFLILFTGVFFLMQSFACCAAGEDNENRYLIVGKPTSIKLIRLSENIGAAVSPAYYKAKLSGVQVVYGGEKKIPNNLTLEIRATDSYAFLQYDRVFMLVDFSIMKNPKVIYWHHVSSLACMPREVISPEYAKYFFESNWGGAQSSCMFIRGRVQPDSNP